MLQEKRDLKVVLKEFQTIFRNISPKERRGLFRIFLEEYETAHTDLKVVYATKEKSFRPEINNQVVAVFRWIISQEAISLRYSSDKDLISNKALAGSLGKILGMLLGNIVYGIGSKKFYLGAGVKAEILKEIDVLIGLLKKVPAVSIKIIGERIQRLQRELEKSDSAFSSLEEKARFIQDIAGKFN